LIHRHTRETKIGWRQREKKGEFEGLADTTCHRLVARKGIADYFTLLMCFSGNQYGSKNNLPSLALLE